MGGGLALPQEIGRMLLREIGLEPGARSRLFFKLLGAARLLTYGG